MIDTTGAVWFVIHIIAANGDEGTYRIGTVRPGGDTAQVTHERPLESAIKLSVARDMPKPYGAIVIGPFDEPESLVVYALFDGEKVDDDENRRIIKRLQEQNSGGVWMDARRRNN